MRQYSYVCIILNLSTGKCTCSMIMPWYFTIFTNSHHCTLHPHIFKALKNILCPPPCLPFAPQGSVCAATWAPCICITSLQWWTAGCSSPAPSTGRWQQCRATWRTSSSLRSRAWCSPSSRSSTGCGCAMIRPDTSTQMTKNLLMLQLGPSVQLTMTNIESEFMNLWGRLYACKICSVSLATKCLQNLILSCFLLCRALEDLFTLKWQC